MSSDSELVQAISSGDAAATRRLLADPVLRGRLDGPLDGLPFGATALLGAVQQGSRELIDAVLEAGASIDQRSHWWAGGFGVLDGDHDLHDFLISRGATVDAYAAARMGRLDLLRDLVAADPAAVRMRGGDGQTPLHVARSVEVAAFLLDHGADLDALDIDHESTPAQYLVRDRPEVARFLVERGCRTDLLLVAALGDLERVRSLLDEDPARIRMAVNERWFPMRNPRAGGHIYIWTIGSNLTAHLAAHRAGHLEVFDFLMSRSPETLRLAVACALGDADAAAALLARPDLLQALDESEARVLPDRARESDLAAVRLMIRAGWPLDARGETDGTALHWASWHGNAVMVRELLDAGAPVDLRDRHYGGTPVHWVLHGSRGSWHPERGDYPAVMEMLLDAGAEVPTGVFDAPEPVLELLRRRSGNRETAGGQQP